jgi:hypothetical protein
MALSRDRFTFYYNEGNVKKNIINGQKEKREEKGKEKRKM